RWAPSSFNEQPWRFLVATKDEPVEFERMLQCLAEANQSWAQHAPVLMLTVASLQFARNGKPNRHALHDVGLAVANLSVQATAIDLSVHQMAGFDREKARDTYNIPEDYEVVTALALGYPGEPNSLPNALQQMERAPRKRKPLGDIAFANKWGQAFE
ncbi:MAG: nitroreductase family protein, partial [bacterium]